MREIQSIYFRLGRHTVNGFRDDGFIFEEFAESCIEEFNLFVFDHALVLDIEGVIYEGNKLIEGSIETINKLLANGFKIKYLTNTTVTPRKQILKKFLKLLHF